MSSSNAQKTPFQRSISLVAEKRALDLIELTGKNLPASVVSVQGSIVTVKFEVAGAYTLSNVTVPLEGSEYARPPIQPGCKGWVKAADVHMGQISGLGGGVADLSMPANLSALVFAPVGSKDFSETDNPNAYLIYGPDGAILRTLDKTTMIVVDATGVVMTIPLTGSFRIVNLPVAPTGPSGSLYNAGGFVKVVP